jgi:hypothetical protein
MSDPRRRYVRMSAVVLLLTGPASAAAQTNRPTAPGPSIPSLTVSVAVGRASMRSEPSPSTSPRVAIQQYFGQHLLVEAEWTRWREEKSETQPGTPFGLAGGFTGTRTDRTEARGWLVGANVLVRSTPRRVAVFGGVGVGFEDSRNLSETVSEGCVPPPGDPFACTNRQFSRVSRVRHTVFQTTTGLDMRISRSLTAYSSLRLSGGSALFRAETGLRWNVSRRELAAIEAARARKLSAADRVPVGRARGREVRILLQDGSRRGGRLVALTSTSVSIDRGSGSTVADVPLTDVRLVELASHAPRRLGLLGLAAGAGAGAFFFLSCDEDLECLGALISLGAMGAGSGVAAGAIYDRATASRHVVWASGSTSVALAPQLSPRAAGIGATIRW